MLNTGRPLNCAAAEGMHSRYLHITYIVRIPLDLFVPGQTLEKSNV